MPSSKEPVTLDGFNTVQALRRARPAPAARQPSNAAPPPAAERAAAPSRPTRIGHTIMPARHNIRCYHCGFEFVQTGRLEKVLCHKCRMFLDTDAHTVDGPWSGRLQTLGTVTIAAAGQVQSGEIAAMDLLLHGSVLGGHVDVMRRLEVFPGACSDLALFGYADLVVHQGIAIAPTGPIRCGTVTVAGELDAVLECSGCVTIAGTARFRGSIRAPALIVEYGATVEADVAAGNDAAQPASAA